MSVGSTAHDQLERSIVASMVITSRARLLVVCAMLPQPDIALWRD
jgi:hypothetical protein